MLIKPDPEGSVTLPLKNVFVGLFQFPYNFSKFNLVIWQQQFAAYTTKYRDVQQIKVKKMALETFSLTKGHFFLEGRTVGMKAIYKILAFSVV